MASPTDVFTEIDSRLAAKPADFDATYAFDLSGEGGGPYHIVLNKEGGSEAGPGAPESPNITISMAAADFVDLATGKLDGTAAFMSGKLKISGDMGLAMKLQKVLRD